MKLYKALKIKKRLGGELNDLSHRLKKCVSTVEGNNFKEPYSDLLTEYNQKQTELKLLKLRIMKANMVDGGKMQLLIMRLGELKDLVTLYRDLDIKSGAETEGSFRGTTVVNYHTQVTEEARVKRIKAYTEEIVKITEELDEFNATTDLPE